MNLFDGHMGNGPNKEFKAVEINPAANHLRKLVTDFLFNRFKIDKLRLY